MYQYKAELIKVIDGDTLDLRLDLGFEIWHIIRIRLNGINCPESRCKDPKEKKLGLEAKAYTQRFCSQSKSIIVETIKTEKFGRYLANIYLDNMANLAEMLIGANIAKEYHGEKRGGWFDEIKVNSKVEPIKDKKSNG